MKRQKLGNIGEIVFPSSSQRTRLSLKYTYFQPKNRPKNNYFAKKDTY